MKRDIKKIRLAILISVNCFFLLLADKTSADWMSISSVASGGADAATLSAIDAAFSKFGVDEEELKYTVKTANVMRRKKQQPQVEISFTPSNPTTAQKITAVATPTGFFNDTKDLYFTWYLKPEGCPDDKDTNPSEETKNKCDFDGNGDIEINDYKVRAARILAGNDFEWEKADYGSGSSGKSYSAIYGGDNQAGKSNHCFVHDIDSGDEYEIACDKPGNLNHHLFPESPDNDFHIGDGSFSLEEEEFFHTDPNDPDTADTGNGDEANIAGLGMNSFSWIYQKGDEVGVAIEGISVESTQESDSSFKIMWALTNNECDLGDVSTDYPKVDTDIEIEREISLGVGVTCPAGSPHAGESTTTQQVTTVHTETLISRVADTATIRTTEIQTKIVDANCNDEYEEASVEVYDETTCPNGPAYDNNYAIQPNCLGKSCYDDDGNGGFDKTITLSLDDLSLTRIENSYDINKCLYENFVDPVEGGGAKTKMEISLSYSPEFPMNDPGTAAAYNKKGDGDQLSIQSSVINADNSGYLKYTWQLFENDNPNPDSWGDPIIKSRLPESLNLSGIGLDLIKLRLNVPGLKKYLKAKVTVSESNSEGSGPKTRTGNASVVIPVSKISQRIKAYSTTITGTPENPVFSLGATERCITKDGNNITPDAICYVAKNEIVGLKLDTGYTDALWMVNNTPITPVNTGGIGGGSNAGAAFFPVLEDNGYHYTVELIATDSNGEKVDLTKAFEVADPEVAITSADESVMKPDLLGHYVDLDGKYWPDYSQKNFFAITDSSIKLQPNFYGITITPDQYSWLVDGFIINKANADSFGYSIDETGVLTLPSKNLGGRYDIALALAYTQDNNTKKVLSKYWNVPYNEFYEKKVGTSIEINFVGSISDVRGAGKDDLPKKILASLYSATPAYIVFLLRIVLTSFAMLIFSKIILSFFPNVQKNEY